MQRKERRMLSVGLESSETNSTKFYVLFFILIMRKITKVYISKGRKVKQEESVYFLFGFLPIYRSINVNNKV